MKKFYSIAQQAKKHAVVDKSASNIRKTFIEYFKANGHQFIPSSSVIPYCDPTVAFVNAGMNQFKNIFVGLSQPPWPTAVNSQKCIRVGGKHNDLAQVGTDGTHHTFFEMLGNWSFGDYFKKEACSKSLALLVDVYELDPNRLYFTYFSGNANLGLEADEETRDIWLELGIPASRVLPFGSKDNFWEMGPTGPCGPCTEIHYDHVPGRTNSSALVNVDGSGVTELWNLVFMMYNRNEYGSLEKLRKHHVDTGMGFERLVSVIQNKTSNYDTDLFIPLLKGIQHITKCPEYQGRFGAADEDGVDTAYRTVADHTRMATVALSDGVLPDRQYRLRNILKKAFLITENVFKIKDKNVIKELSAYVAETLGDAYPEIMKNLPKIQHIIQHEEELMKTLRMESQSDWSKITSKYPGLRNHVIVGSPGLVQYIKYLEDHLLSNNAKTLDHDILFKLNETFGVEEDTLLQVASSLGLNCNAVNIKEYQNFVDQKKLAMKLGIYSTSIESRNLSKVVNDLRNKEVPPTDDYWKYEYRKIDGEKYKFREVASSILGIIMDNKLVDILDPNMLNVDESIGLILDRTVLYSEAGGQESDSGKIIIEKETEFIVKKVVNIGSGYIVHYGRFQNNLERPIQIEDMCNVRVNVQKRLSNMKNHTATHLLNAVLKNMFLVTAQRSSSVTSNLLSFTFSIYKEVIGPQEIVMIEKKIKDVILHNVPVQRWTVDGCQLSNVEHLTLMPGEVYPDRNISIIDINSGYFVSREACCGTHILDTGDIKDFVVLSLKSVGVGLKKLEAVTGELAIEARNNGIKILEELDSLQLELHPLNNLNEKEAELSKKLEILKKKVKNFKQVPYTTKCQITEKIEEMESLLLDSKKKVLKEIMEAEMKEIIKNNTKSYLVHLLPFSLLALQKATRMCPNMPVLIFSYSNSLVKAKCCVPQHLVSSELTAEKWLSYAMQDVKGIGSPPRGQDPVLYYNMKEKRLRQTSVDNLIRRAHLFMETIDKKS